MITFWAVIAAIGLPLLLAFVFRVFLIGPADATRSYLAKQRTGWRRRRYVRIFVEAIHGEAKVDDSIAVARIEFFYPIVIVVVGALALAEALVAQRNKTELIQRTNVLLARLEGNTSEPTPTEKSELEELLEIRRQLSADSRKLVKLKLLSIALLVAANGWVLWLVAVRFPFVRYRTWFAHELDRFTLRIQGLASKSELALLVQKEAEVKDEQSAKEFVDMMAKIADRHGVRSLVDTFLLWGPPTPEPASQTAASPS